MCRIHLVLVLGSTKGLATTAIIPESIKKEKKNQKKKKKKKKKKKIKPRREALTRKSLSQW